jgi:hypothetical protein
VHPFAVAACCCSDAYSCTLDSFVSAKMATGRDWKVHWHAELVRNVKQSFVKTMNTIEHTEIIASPPPQTAPDAEARALVQKQLLAVHCCQPSAAGAAPSDACILLCLCQGLSEAPVCTAPTHKHVVKQGQAHVCAHPLLQSSKLPEGICCGG